MRSHLRWLQVLVRAVGRLASSIGPYVIRERAIAQTDPVMVRVSDSIDRRARTHDQASGWGRAPILQIVPDRDTGLEGSGVTRPYERFGRAFDNSNLAGEDIDHLIFGAVPVLD